MEDPYVLGTAREGGGVESPDERAGAVLRSSGRSGRVEVGREVEDIVWRRSRRPGRVRRGMRFKIVAGVEEEYRCWAQGGYGGRGRAFVIAG
jgi:hypothetical protein